MFWGGRVGFRQESAGAERVDGLRFFKFIFVFNFFIFFCQRLEAG